MRNDVEVMELEYHGESVALITVRWYDKPNKKWIWLEGSIKEVKDGE